jgi:hypothetical protein
MNKERTVGQERDPDPFVIGGLVLAAIATVAQLTSLAYQVADRPLRSAFPQVGPILRRGLADALDETHRTTERLAQFLSHAGRGAPSLDAPFRSGAVSLLLTRDEMAEYEVLLRRLVFQIADLSEKTIGLMREDEQFAHALGEAVARRINSIAERVNDMLAPERTLGFVLEEALFVLRTLQRVLADMRGSGNLSGP